MSNITPQKLACLSGNTSLAPAKCAEACSGSALTNTSKESAPHLPVEKWG